MTLAGRALSYGGVALPVAALGTHVQGGLPAGATAAVALLGVMMLLARAHLGGFLPSPGRRARRIGAPLLAVVLVASIALSGAGPSPVDNAAAVTGSGTCSFASILHFFGVADDCVVGSTTTEVQQVKNAEDNQTALQIYNAAAAQQASSKQLLASTANYANNSRNVAWSKAEIAYYQALENGSVQSVAVQRGQDAIRDHYSKRQISLVKSLRIQYHALKSLHDRASNESGVSEIFDFKPYAPVDGFTSEGHSSWSKTTTVNSMLVNSSTIETPAWYGESSYNTGDGVSTADRTIAIGGSRPDKDWAWSKQPFERIVATSPPNTSLDAATVLDMSEYQNRWQQYEDLSAELKTEFSTYANNTYPAVESGRINASEVVSRETRMFQLGTQASESGSLYDSVAALSMMGLATPNLNGTGTMTVNYQNRQYHGLLLAPDVPNGSWTAGTSYNATAPPLNGSAILATTTGETVPLDSGTFRLASISSQNGESMESVNATRSQYQTTNVTKLVEQLNETQQLIEDVEARQAAGGGGGSGGAGGGGGSSPVIVAGLGVLALGLVIYLKNRSN
ncbi:hypothetical protein J2754_000738 [Halarchaeum solikamskense]|uniref:hypothetical protein n=1 Tax=Halarchaeum nitratireducens TaxID=489913 RepID=UPI001B3ACB7C|nr:hypothetical protein [Halarchaeum solikamskense]MBP2250441.1 hypothetical protein [Halarchaeum solikamskense]